MAATETHHPRNEWAAETHVYEPHTVGLPPLREYFAEAFKRREFALELAQTKLKARAYNTVFGQLWLIINPVMLALVYFVLIDIIRSGNKPPDFFVHLVGAVFVYYYVSGAIRDGAKSVVRGGKLILNSSFPRLLLPISSVLVALRNFVPTLVIFIPLWLLSDRPVTVHLLWIPVLLILATLMATGLAILAATIQVYFRDFLQFLPYGLRMMLYTAPVLYLVPQVPDRYEWLLDLNPVAQLLACFDHVLYFGEVPSLHAILAATVWAVASMLVGCALFLSREREFAVRI